MQTRQLGVWALAAALIFPAAAAWGQAKGKTLAQVLAARRQAEQQKQLAAQRQAAAKTKKPATPQDKKFYGSTQKRQTLPLWTGNLGKPLDEPALDALLTEEIGPAASAVADELFLRRAYLALIGELPAPADVKEYVAATDPKKKEALVDRLLALPQFGKNLARRWHDAISFRNTVGKNREVPYLGFEHWLTEQFNSNQPWSATVTAMIAAEGPASEHPEALLYGAHGEAPPELAGGNRAAVLGHADGLRPVPRPPQRPLEARPVP